MVSKTEQALKILARAIADELYRREVKSEAGAPVNQTASGRPDLSASSPQAPRRSA